MRRFLTVLLATVSVIVAAESVRAQQAPAPRSGDAKLLAVSSRSVDSQADLDLIVIPSEQFYPDSTIREPIFLKTNRFEAGIMGRTFPEGYRAELLRSLFPIDDADASTSLAIYVQANFR
jgi:hypothetical protein